MLDFSMNAGLWGANGPTSIDYDFNDFYFSASGSPEINPKFGFGGLIFAEVGAKLGLSYDVGFGLVGHAKLDLGSADIALSIDPSANVSKLEDTINTKSYIDTSGFTVGASSLTATGVDLANSSIELDLAGKLKAELYGGLNYRAGVTIPAIKVFGVTITPEKTFDTSGGKDFRVPIVDYQDSINLISIDGADVDPYHLDFTYGTLDAELPKFNFSGGTGTGLDPIYAFGTSNNIVSLGLDVDAALLAMFGLPPNLLSGSFGFDIGVAAAKVDYTILDAKLVGTAKLEQQLIFDPEVAVKMTSSFGETLEGELGNKLEFETPEGEGTFTVTADYTVHGSFSSTLGMRVGAEFDYKLLDAYLKAKLGVSVFGKYIGGEWTADPAPLVDGKLGIGGGIYIPLFNDTSEYVGQTITETYNVAYEKFVTAASGAVLKLTTHQLSLEAGDEDNLITGNALDNTIFGNGGDDTISAGNGNDTIDGGAGNDTIVGGRGGDAMRGELGIDTVVYSTAVLLDLVSLSRNTKEAAGDTFFAVEQFQFSTQNDAVYGSNMKDTFLAGGGADALYGRFGNDVLKGEKGNDTIDGGSGNDRIVGGLGSDRLTGGKGSDVFEFGTLQERGDKIFDFSHIERDKIELSRSGFELAKSFKLKVGSTLFFDDGPDSSRPAFIYSSETGLLSFDSNGEDRGGRFSIATVLEIDTLKASDFLLVA